MIEHYLQEATIQLKPWDKANYAQIPDLHTNISVYKRVRGRRGGSEETKVPVEGSVNGIFTTEVDGRLPLRILLIGGAGYGKTTTIAKLVYDWATQAEDGPLNEICLLFALKFRETDSQTSLGSAIRSQLLGTDFPVTPEQVEKLLSENDEDCCMLLDGYDEFPGSIVGKGRQSSLVELVLCKKFKGTLVLVTSRPHRKEDFDTGNLPKLFVKMELEGYTVEDTERYIGRFFKSDPHKGDTLIAHAREQRRILDFLFRIPFFCMVLCCLWEGGLLKDATTLTQIFNSLLTYLTQHAKSKTLPRSPAMSFSAGKLKSMLYTVGKIAFESLLSDSQRLIFTEEDFGQCSQELDNFVTIGLLSKQEVIHDPTELFEDPNSTLVEFYHKLAQEHCAGLYVSSLPANDLKQVLCQLGTREKILDLENVLLFAAGSSANVIPLINQVVGVHWPEETFMKQETDSYRVLLNMLAESRPCDESLLASRLQPHFVKGSLNLCRLSGSMIHGLEKLPSIITSMVRTFEFESSVGK